jgi:aryl carrier-like protein
VTEIWKDILGVDEVDGDTDFFAAGGQSVLLVRMIARLRQTFAVAVSLPAVAARPTVHGVTGIVHRMMQEQGNDE